MTKPATVPQPTTLRTAEMKYRHPSDLVSLKKGAREELVPGPNGKPPHLSTLYRWHEEGKLRFWKQGRTTLVSRAELRALIRPAEKGNSRPQSSARRRTNRKTLKAAGVVR